MDESSVQHTSMLPENNLTTQQNFIENAGKFTIRVSHQSNSRKTNSYKRESMSRGDGYGAQYTDTAAFAAL